MSFESTAGFIDLSFLQVIIKGLRKCSSLQLWSRKFVFD